MSENRFILPFPTYFLRHGQTAWNAAHIVAGKLDIPLDEIGREQAQEAAHCLAEEPIASIWCSPLGRCRDTVAPLATRLGLPVTLVPELCERDWGQCETRPEAERPPRSQTPEGGESLDDFKARTRRGIALVTGPWPALIVAHSGTYRVILSDLGLFDDGEPVENAFPIRIDANGPHPLVLPPSP